MYHTWLATSYIVHCGLHTSCVSLIFLGERQKVLTTLLNRCIPYVIMCSAWMLSQRLQLFIVSIFSLCIWIFTNISIYLNVFFLSRYRVCIQIFQHRFFIWIFNICRYFYIDFCHGEILFCYFFFFSGENLSHLRSLERSARHIVRSFVFFSL